MSTEEAFGSLKEFILEINSQGLLEPIVSPEAAFKVTSCLFLLSLDGVICHLRCMHIYNLQESIITSLFAQSHLSLMILSSIKDLYYVFLHLNLCLVGMLSLVIFLSSFYEQTSLFFHQYSIRSEKEIKPLSIFIIQVFNALTQNISSTKYNLGKNPHDSVLDRLPNAIKDELLHVSNLFCAFLVHFVVLILPKTVHFIF